MSIVSGQSKLNKITVGVGLGVGVCVACVYRVCNRMSIVFVNSYSVNEIKRGHPFAMKLITINLLNFCSLLSLVFLCLIFVH